jgi:organic radical activating enzyme
MKKVFPIKTETACQYKWAWSSVFLSEGSTSSCHRVMGGYLDETNFKNFHNLPLKIRDRELMLKGEWPNNECNYCKRIEDAGGVSERTGYINNIDMVPPELETDPTATHVTPRILEIYFSNLCNQSCVYCSPMFSSVIEHEIKKFGPISERYNLHGRWAAKPLYEQWKREFWEWMEENAQHLYDFQVLGGEPMFQPEFQECLDFFETHDNPNLNWKVFSNLKHNTQQFETKMNKIVSLIQRNKIRRFEIVCSIDCWDEEQEYARNGMTLRNWEDNFNILLNIPEISVFIQSTLSPITLPTAYKLTDKIVEWNKTKHIRQGWNVVAHPTFLDPSVFGDYLTEYTDKLVESASKLDNSYVNYLEGFAVQIKSSAVNKEQMAELRNYLDELDVRRNQNWRSIYPWMDKIFIKELDSK